MRAGFCLILWVSLIAAGCAPTVSRPQSDVGWVRTELYFGLSRKDASDISSDQFTDFLNTVVTTRFPDGLTVEEGNGQWRNHEGVVTHEHSKVLVLFHKESKADTDAIEAIRSEYKKRFNQESVMCVNEPVDVRF